MGGSGHQCAHLPGTVNDGGGQGRALHRVGARTQLVHQNQGVSVGDLQNAHQGCHMGGERGQRLGNGLLVTDVGQHPRKNPHGRIVLGGDVQAALCHQGNQAQGLERHGLAAGVGSGDDQGVKPLPQLQVVGHRLFGVQQRVPRPPELQKALRQPGLAPAHPQGELSPRKDAVQPDQKLVVL